MSSFLIDDRMMYEGLKLKGCCLLLFAMAMSYHTAGKSLYESERAIAERTGYAREVVGRSLQALVKAGYLTRSECVRKGHRVYEYRIGWRALEIFEECDKKSQEEVTDVTKYHTSMREKVTDSCDKKSHNKIIDNKAYNYEQKYSKHSRRNTDVPRIFKGSDSKQDRR